MAEIRFATDVLKEVAKLLKRSWKTNRETGSKLCGREDEMSLGTTCTGEACEIEIKDCGTKPVVGSLHTHPHSSPYLNEGDVLAGSVERDRVTCVCGNAKAPGIALDLEEPQPFENLLCRCSRIDVDKEAYDKVVEIWKRYEPEVEREMEETEKRNEQLEREGKPYRYRVSPIWTRAYGRAREEAEPYIERILKKLRYREFVVPAFLASSRRGE